MESKETRKSSEMNVEDLPDVRAFQDEFTRNFLQSTEETRSGYYPFLSGTGKYKMDFPAGGIIGEKSYALEKERFESYLIGVQKESVKSSVDITYTAEKEGNEKVILDMLRKSSNEELKFKKEELQGRGLYIAPLNENGEFGFVSYIQNLSGVGGIQVFYVSECNKENENCSKDIEKENSLIIDWLKTIQFVNKENESE
ncbi:hypothetical protein [Virgibacillus proomii]|uniref:hypothetical protein n=1 Tax=Virgibacillus proomii TaxID=84407 RepID=UPI001C10B523|nr:hypothetical protein [Virgibacillus proomii]MBU5266814.1 hypothetical protein [Virgibacillus proomii]